MLNRKSIVFLGYSLFPRGLAEVQKIILISKCLLLTGNDVTVVCTNGIHNRGENSDLKQHGYYDNIEYVYTSGSAFRNKQFVKRRVLETKGVLNEILYLRRRRRRKKLDFAILSTGSFYNVLFYYFISKFLGFKTILNYVEFYSSMRMNQSHFGRRLNAKLFDRYAPSLTDAVLPISEFLIHHIQEVAPKKRYFKIPGLTDFDRYNGIEKKETEKYFMFCGSADFREIIEFIIGSFALLDNNTSIFLYLVANGNESSMLEIKKIINAQPQRDKIKLFSWLTEKELYTYYKNATALLIPLRPTFQDMARFPHKTGEYLASGNPVISTNYGEVKYYFKDMENMLLANSYDMQLFAEKMQFVILNPLDAQKIGEKGKYVASQIFDYRIKAAALDDFLNSNL